jgi:transcription initiation factor TFIID subunit 5
VSLRSSCAAQPELLRVLYPVFVHCYLELLRGRSPALARELLSRFGSEHEVLHAHELRQLGALFTEEHAAASPLAATFQANRFTVALCRYAFELLMAFLQSAGDAVATLTLALINEHVQLRVRAGEPGGGADGEAEGEVAPRTGLPQDTVRGGLKGPHSSARLSAAHTSN